MTKHKAILHLLVLAHSAMLGYAACTIGNNRFIGKDKGIVLPVAFSYDITVQADITRKDVNTIILAIEKAFATRSAQRLIVACSPEGTDTSKFSNIVGMNLDPNDSIARVCSTGEANCYTVHSQVTLYTKSSNNGAAQAYLSAIEALLSGEVGFTNTAIVSLGNIKSANVKATPGLRTKAPTKTPAKADGNTTLKQKMEILRRENQPAFIGMSVGIAVVSILIISGVSYGINLWCINMNEK